MINTEKNLKVRYKLIMKRGRNLLKSEFYLIKTRKRGLGLYSPLHIHVYVVE